MPGPLAASALLPFAERVERDAPHRDVAREPGPRLEAPADPTGDGTTRERPVNRPGIRPLARHESAGPDLPATRRRVEPREVGPLVLSGREVL